MIHVKYTCYAFLLLYSLDPFLSYYLRAIQNKYISLNDVKLLRLTLAKWKWQNLRSMLWNAIITKMTCQHILSINFIAKRNWTPNWCSQKRLSDQNFLLFFNQVKFSVSFILKRKPNKSRSVSQVSQRPKLSIATLMGTTKLKNTCCTDRV